MDTSIEKSRRADDQLETLVRRCQHGERAAFEDIFQRFQPRLRYYIRRMDAVNGRVEDVLQEIWVKVVRRIGSLRDRKAFVAWLYRIARNEVYGRAKDRDPFVTLTDEHLELPADVVEPTFDQEDAARLHEALQRLKYHHREILTLYFLEELSHRQIAEILGIRCNSVRTRIYYAKQALRKEMGASHE
ncbi:MAG: sigma-70 family RNA polymerase sigma factor [Sedimentisphaerales bacterium]|nr:sigma-70 family RNA polymerase sigma factor [Sedimentisphaerales bacterium]